jgi:hypothetical protein
VPPWPPEREPLFDALFESEREPLLEPRLPDWELLLLDWLDDWFLSCEFDCLFILYPLRYWSKFELMLAVATEKIFCSSVSGDAMMRFTLCYRYQNIA